MKNASMLIHPEELSLKWVDRLVKYRIPTLALHPVGGREADKSLERMLKLSEDKNFTSIIDYACEKGLKIEYEMHAVRYLLPADEFETHPDWFRVDKDGKRTPDFNFCASNEEALDFICERAVGLVKKLYRSTSSYFLWLDDSKDSRCHCAECSKLTPSDQQLKILNRIAVRLKSDDPLASLAYLAYFDCMEPPQIIKPEKNIFLEYAPIERNMHRPLLHGSDDRALKKLLGVFGKDTAKILEYWYDNSLFSGWKKPPERFSPDKAVIFSDFEFYRSFGIEDIGSFACYLGEDYEKIYGEADFSPFADAYNSSGCNGKNTAVLI